MAKKEDNVDEADAAPAKKSKKVEADAAPAKKSKKAVAEDTGKSAKKGKSAAKAERAPRGESRAEEIRTAIRKTKKPTSYADICAKGGEGNEFDIRSVRRTARAMRDAGEAELTKEGRDVFVKGVQ